MTGEGEQTHLAKASRDSRKRRDTGRASAPARFLSYLVAALRTVGEGIGEGVLAALRSSEPPRIEALMATLINEMAVFPAELALVFNDYHAIDSKPVHDAVAFLLEYLPPNVHLVIAGRIDPPLPLAKLRARDQIIELGAAELSFTSEEAAAFLKDVMGLELSAEDVAVLEEQTEGWIAGLQLAALSMRDRKGFCLWPRWSGSPPRSSSCSAGCSASSGTSP